MIKHKAFIKNFVTAVTEGYAAIFAGAGLSCSSGYINWRDLLRPLANDIDLDVDKEHDLAAVAQYRRNEYGTRSAMNAAILNEFTKNSCENENVDIITRLPINTYWTTNYDELLEEGLRKNNRKADIKRTQESLANNIYDRDAVVYKMHGDVRDPSAAILTKDDYEMYESTHPLFRTALQGDLISKTFLFIGFSFEDPNLDYILSRIRVLLGESNREHYCFFEKINRSKFSTAADHEYKYACVRQNHRVKDLRRYGIIAVLLDSYSEITDILHGIECRCLLKNVFVSGSLSKFFEPWNENCAYAFSHQLGKRLVKDDNKIISGFGLGIGSTIINGALEEVMNSKYKHVDEHLCLRPFPQVSSGSMSMKELWNAYREEMINQAGIAIFIFGNKEKDGDVVIADGMLQEFEISKKLGKIIIPVGSTGGAAAEIFSEVLRNKEDYPHLNGYFDLFHTCTDSTTLVNAICDIVKSVQSL